MKYDLSKLFMDYCAEEEAIALTKRFWEKPFNMERQRAIEAIENRLTPDEVDRIYEFAASNEELGFIEGFRLAVQFIATGNVTRAPQMEVLV